MTDGLYTKVYDPKYLRKDQVDFEVAQVNKLVAFDSRKLNYNDMTDSELEYNQLNTYSFRFMQTRDDKEFARQAILKRFAKTRK